MEYQSPKNNNIPKNYQNQVQSSLNMNINKHYNEQNNRESNSSKGEMHEQKTNVLMLGEKFETKNIKEAFEKRIQSQNEIKKKIINKNTEIIPIDNNKKKDAEEAPELPMIKQKVTNEYKTAIIKDKDQKTKDFDGQNGYKNSNLIDKTSSPKQFNPQELQ